MLDLPDYISKVFILTTVLTFGLMRWLLMSLQTKKVIVISLAATIWIAIHGYLGYVGLYRTDLDQIPPKLLLFGFIPFVLFTIFVLVSKVGNDAIRKLSFGRLTTLSIVRIPVEFCLYWLALNGVVPEIMSFAGWNFDIVAGVLAIPVLLLINTKYKIPVLWIWNILGTILLITIIVIAIFSAPFPLQQFAMDQPNVAILYFPFVWLATFVAPVVLLTHFISLKKLIQGQLD